MQQGRHSEGFTIIEMMVALTIMVVTTSFAVPFFQKTIEQTRVDIAANYLETIWTAQRLYNAQNHVFCASIDTLKQAKLLDQSFPENGADPKAKFSYTITFADATAFSASAIRINSAHWTGHLFINEQGILSGEISGMAGETISFTQG